MWHSIGYNEWIVDTCRHTDGIVVVECVVDTMQHNMWEWDSVADSSVSGDM
jgi:hypothetical protein